MYLLRVVVMNDFQPSSLLPARALFLSRSESTVRADARLLRSLGVAVVAHLTDSSQAAAFLEKSVQSPQADASHAKTASSVDIVISDEHLADAPASVFLYSLAKHPTLKSQPVLVLTGTAESSRRLRSAGIYLLERPYTVENLARMLRKATSPERRFLQAEVFENASTLKGVVLQQRMRKTPPRPTGPVTTTDWFKKGMDSLRKDELGDAEYAFSHVLGRQEDHVEAALGLAKVYRARDDANAMRRCLLRAAASCLRKGDKVFAANISAVLPVNMRDGIFFYEALARMEAGEFKAAALGFLDAAKENSSLPLHHIVSRACLLTTKPEECMRKVCAAFSAMGHKATADRLHRRLLVYPEFAPERESSWLDTYPRLRDAVDVVSGTTLAWKYAQRKFHSPRSLSLTRLTSLLRVSCHS